MNALLICALLAAFVGLSVCDMKADFDKVVDICKVDHKISDDEAKQLHEMIQYRAVINKNASEDFKCFLHCFLEKRGHLKGGVLNTETVLNNMKELLENKEHYTVFEKSLGECKNVKGANDCDTAFKLILCLNEHHETIVA